ncbi:hypothetical protein ACHAXS_004394 [Conticribra weissflogii]
MRYCSATTSRTQLPGCPTGDHGRLSIRPTSRNASCLNISCRATSLVSIDRRMAGDFEGEIRTCQTVCHFLLLAQGDHTQFNSLNLLLFHDHNFVRKGCSKVPTKDPSTTNTSYVPSPISARK